MIEDAQCRSSWSLRVGFWLFRHRGWVPVPFYAVLVGCPYWGAETIDVVWPSGAALIVLGHLLRIWATRHIGRSARTRRANSAKLVTGGPYAHVRNPLYVANISMGIGFALFARLVWFAPVMFLFSVAHYSLIVRWEEHLLGETWGESYREYMKMAPRWLPTRLARGNSAPPPHSYGHAFYRDRRTVTATAVMVSLLVAKSLVF